MILWSHYFEVSWFQFQTVRLFSCPKCPSFCLSDAGSTVRSNLEPPFDQASIRSLEKLFGLMKVGDSGIDKSEFRSGMRRKSHFNLEFTDDDLDTIFYSIRTSKTEDRIFRKDLKKFFRSNKF